MSNYYNVTLFGLHMKINPIAFTIPIGEGWNVYWYGILVATGFLLAVLYAMYISKRMGINQDKLLDCIIIATPVSILCARAYYIIFSGEKLKSIGDFFGFGDNGGFTGLAIYGGVIGAAVCTFVLSKLFKLNLLNLLDMVSAGFLLGQAVGRWGNFVNQEAFGSATGSKWFGMNSEIVEYELGPGNLAHPCFLYESIWCLIGFFLLNSLIKKRKYRGQVALSYGIWYGFGRFVIELLRTDSLMVGSIRISCLLSLLLCITCLVLLLVFNSRQKEMEKGEYTPLFLGMESDTEDFAEDTDVTEAETAESNRPANEIIAESEKENENGEDN